MPERVVRVGAVHDLPEEKERRVTTEPVLLQYGFERALLAVVAQLDSFYIVGSGAQPRRFAHNLLGGREEELRLRIDELLDQPRARDPVDFHALSGNPLHVVSPP